MSIKCSVVRGSVVREQEASFGDPPLIHSWFCQIMDMGSRQSGLVRLKGWMNYF